MAISITGAMSDTDKFMDKFDPVNSNRELRKKMRTQPGSGNESSGNGLNKNGKNKKDKKTSNHYNEKGMLLIDGTDLCDCLNDDCIGCFFPCPKCRSAKCGSECRVNRRWVLENVSVDGTSEVTKNNHLNAPQ